MIPALIVLVLLVALIATDSDGRSGPSDEGKDS
jgi:hypothetical protein